MCNVRHTPLTLDTLTVIILLSLLFLCYNLCILAQDGLTERMFVGMGIDKR